MARPGRVSPSAPLLGARELQSLNRAKEGEPPAMRYRQDVPRGTDLDLVCAHVRDHLAGAVHPDDDLRAYADAVRIAELDHVDGDSDRVSVIGEVDGEPDAPYLRPGYDPAADHPEITFRPYEEPHLGHGADHDALQRFRELGRGS